MLTLYRRHTKACSKGYAQNYRVFKPRSRQQERADCGCPISAEGTLETEGLITNRSTKKTTWTDAFDISQQWEAWGQTTEPDPDHGDNPSIRYAVDSFLTTIGPTGRNIDHSTSAGFNVLLVQRLLPFAESKNFTHIREFDDLDVTTKFTESWINLQPNRNRKQDSIIPNDVPLADSTKKAELERLRSFFEYCRERGWLKHNQAKKIRFTFKTAQKFGLEADEENRVWNEIDRFDSKRSDHRAITSDGVSYAALELRAFCMVMRYGGLRISDATALNDTALVPRASGKGWAFFIHQRKTDEWVYVPITDETEAILRKLSFKCEKDGKRYWFWTGEGKIDTAVNNWYMKVMKIVKRVAAQKTFRHSVTPHTFRHTFSIRHLNAGTGIKVVSGWLGHKSVRITEKHYAHAIESTRKASDQAYNESMKRQEAA